VCIHIVNRFEIESLMNIFKQQTKAKLDRPKFRDVLHNQFDMTDDLIMDRGDCNSIFLHFLVNLVKEVCHRILQNEKLVSYFM